MALDDGGSQIDPATLPENIALMNKIDAQIAAAEKQRDRQRELESRLASAVPDAVSRIEQRVVAREASHAREEDLRGGIADALRSAGELVLTEAKLAVPGWTPNLGGFDLAVVIGDSLVLGETKWADGNLYECIWDMFKLGSALALRRVDAAVAVYGAPVKHWHKPVSCARLFEDREVLTRNLIWALPHEWEVNLAGSSAKPVAMPVLLKIHLLSSTTHELLGKSWEVRAVGITSDGSDYTLTNGWPPGQRPDPPKPYPW